MFCKGLIQLRKSALPLAMATLILAGTSVALSSTTAGASTSASSSSGVWPGVGKICEPGSGGASTVRGVSSKTINIAVFNDAANTIDPGLEVEFPQQATAFADWCNAAGGINGRKIVIDNRDAALFNAAQQATAACQSDFMAVGGGMALDQPSVPIREKCGLGQISGYLVSNVSDLATLQVDPSGINTSSISSGWFGALAKAYPKAVKVAGMGAADTPSVLQAETKYEFGAEAQGWKVVDFLEPPTSVENWAPYVEDYQSKGVEALWPADNSNFTPFAQAMTTAGYHPAFVLLTPQFANSQTQQAVVDNPSLPPVYVESSFWPLSMASQNPSTEELVTTLHKYAKGDTIDFDDEEGAESWLLWAKSASACGISLTVTCVLSHAAATKNWDAGGIQAPIAKLTLSNENPQPSPCFTIMKGGPKGWIYDKAITKPTQSIWNCNPKNVVQLTAAQQAQLNAL
ncbi:MAG: ABC transporter substrate-binding protein [Acidimicrobiales bacterium]|jgi:ABC-type branched-subunit amino acid transport system substrate-binding protein